MSSEKKIDRRRGALRDAACVALIFVLSAVYFYPYWARGRVFLPADLLYNQMPWGALDPGFERAHNPEPSDAIQQQYPWRLFYRESVLRGEVPLWNPHQFCGAPFAANDQSAVFYPFNSVFYLLFDVAAAYTISAWFHLWLGGLFMFLLLRYLRAGRAGGLAGAAVFMFNGFAVVWMGHASKQAAMTWLPLVLLLAMVAARRRSVRAAWLCAAACGVMLTAGFLQFASYTILALAFYLLYELIAGIRDAGHRKAVVCAGLIAGVAGLALAAVHVWPVLELAAQAERPVRAAAEGGFRGLELKHIVNIVRPDHFGNPVDYNYRLDSPYTRNTFFVPWIALALSVAAAAGLFGGQRPREERLTALFFVLLGAFALASMFGAPVYAVYYYLVPGAGTLLAPRIGYLFTFSAAVLAGLGMKTLIGWLAGGGGARRVVAVCAAAIVLAGIIASLLPWAMRFNTFTERRLLFPETAGTELIKRAAGPARVYSGDAGWVLFPNTATVLGVDDVRGYDSLYPARSRRFMEAIQFHWGRTLERRDATVADAPSVHWAAPLDWINTTFIISTEKPDIEWYEKVAVDGDAEVFINKRAYRRIFFSEGYRVTANDEEALKTITSPEFRPEKELLLSRKPRPVKHIKSQTGGAAASSYSIECRAANEMLLDVTAAGDTMLFISDTYYPGWRARLDGAPTEVLRANYNFRAVAIPSGEHRLRMWFSPASARLGLAISMLSLLTVLIFSLAAGRGDSGLNS